MHPNSSYHEVSFEENFKFACQRGFGNLVVSLGIDSSELLIASIPFVAEGKCSPTGCDKLKAHLVRSNPLAEFLSKIEFEEIDKVGCTLIVSGPDCYVSPDWYGIDDQVPTWNYISIQIKGFVKLLPEEELVPVIDALSTNFESRMEAIKSVWTTSKMDGKKLNMMTKAIVPIEISVTDVKGTWKLGQLKPQEARLRVAENMTDLVSKLDEGTLGLGLGITAIAKLHDHAFGGTCAELMSPTTNQSKKWQAKLALEGVVPLWIVMVLLAIVVALIVKLHI